MVKPSFPPIYHSVASTVSSSDDHTPDTSNDNDSDAREVTPFSDTSERMRVGEWVLRSHPWVMSRVKKTSTTRVYGCIHKEYCLVYSRLPSLTRIASEGGTYNRFSSEAAHKNLTRMGRGGKRILDRYAVMVVYREERMGPTTAMPFFHPTQGTF